MRSITAASPATTRPPASGRPSGRADPARFPHLNACLVTGGELVCAGSNYPSVPQTSAVEVFDPVKMTHKRTIPLGPGIGP